MVTKLASLRARMRHRPCRVGLHQFVLTFDGRTYRQICEHCGAPKEATNGSR